MGEPITFDGRVAVITGAGGGLGREYALELGRRGAMVVVNDLGGAVDGSGASHSAADLVVDEIKDAGGEAVASYDSVATREGGEGIIQTALDAFGSVDVVINNAGILRDKSFANMTLDEVDAVLDVHLKGAFHVSHPAFKVMKERGVHEGCIEQVDGLFRDSLYGSDPFQDEEGRLRADRKELDPAVQAAVAALWEQINTDNLRQLSDFDGYKREFLQLFGFEVEGVDYEADVNPDVAIANLA